MDLLPKSLFRLLRPVLLRQQLLKWHMGKAERNTGVFSTALPMITVTSFFIGIGVLVIDKQREMAFYRIQSVGLRRHQLDEEHDQLVQFLKNTTIPAQEVECKPTGIT